MNRDCSFAIRPLKRSLRTRISFALLAKIRSRYEVILGRYESERRVAWMGRSIAAAPACVRGILAIGGAGRILLMRLSEQDYLKSKNFRADLAAQGESKAPAC
jgi:hypothetical protein